MPNLLLLLLQPPLFCFFSLYWVFFSVFLWKKNNIYTTTSYLKKIIAHLYYYTKLLLYVKKLEVRTVRHISFFLHIRWRIATTGKRTELGLSFFYSYYYWNKKQKLYLLKNDILLSDLRYYHRLTDKQKTNSWLFVNKQLIVNKTKLNKHYFDDKKLWYKYCVRLFALRPPSTLPPLPNHKIPLLSNFLFKKSSIVEKLNL